LISLPLIATSAEREMKKKQLALTAHHEAGHALACLVYGFAIRKVSIKRKARTEGRVKTERSLVELLGEGSDENLRTVFARRRDISPDFRRHLPTFPTSSGSAIF
jgi:hypothetical protein